MRQSERKKVLDAVLEAVGAGLEVSYGPNLRDLTTIRVGGPATVLLRVKTMDALQRSIQALEARQVPWMVLGRGSNVLFPDSGFNGAIIQLRGDFLTLSAQGGILTAGGGLPLSRLMGLCIRQGLGGLEFLVGIPGTVGGAVKMNAGAFKREVKDVLLWAEVITRKGVTRLDPESLGLSYRSSSIPKGGIVTYAALMTEDSSPSEVRTRMKNFMERRASSQPHGLPSMGSVFKNPPGTYAGKLVESCGLKGYRVGGASVSDKHANFIINNGDASQKDIMELINFISNVVYERKGIKLELEVECVE